MKAMAASLYRAARAYTHDQETAADLEAVEV
jgi:hypothetical protein